MKFKRVFAQVLPLLLLAALAGCSSGQGGGTKAPEESAIVVKDMIGREIRLEAAAERVVALTASDCEILYAIGAGDTLVGRGEYCDYPEAVKEVPAVQSGDDTNIEQIIDLDPQVVIMSTMAQTDEQIAALEAAGIKVVVSDAKDIEGVYTAIELIGSLMGREDEAAAVIRGMKDTFSELKNKVQGESGKTVYFEVSPLEYGLWTAGKGTFMHEIATMLGVTNIFADLNDWAEVSEEQVLSRNPDYIVTTTMYFGEGPKPEEEILSRAGWQGITAVKNGAVLNEDSYAITRPGPRLADGSKILYNFFYGEN